ncbi:hypothetical protein AB9G26_08950 [Francisella philomiragia]|uniref:hypothetical protein n=1 Tax=Francisella philomiragia TaxID=28110 RepID=UPI0035148D3A
MIPFSSAGRDIFDGFTRDKISEDKHNHKCRYGSPMASRVRSTLKTLSPTNKQRTSKVNSYRDPSKNHYYSSFLNEKKGGYKDIIDIGGKATEYYSLTSS